MRWTHLFAALLLALPLSARAQDEKPDQPEEKSTDPKKPNKAPDVLRTADAKIAKAKSITFKASVHAVGALATRSPQATGTVTMVRDAKAEPGFLFIARGPAIWSGKDTDTRDFSTAFDGKVVRGLHEKDK